MAKKRKPELSYEKAEGKEQGVTVTCGCGHVIGNFGCIENNGERDADLNLSLQCTECKEWHSLDNSIRGLGLRKDEDGEEDDES